MRAKNKRLTHLRLFSRNIPAKGFSLLLLFFFKAPCFGQNLPYLPPELKSVFESEIPVSIPRPVATGKFRKLPAGDGFVWIAEASKVLEKGNHLAFKMNFDATLREKEVALIAIRARTVNFPIDSSDKQRPGQIRIHVAERENLGKTALYHLAKIGKNWGWYYHPFRSAKSIDSEKGVVRFSFDLQKQAIEIEEVRLYTAPPGFDMSRLPMMETGYQGREPDAPWRKHAEKRITQFRTGKLQIKITDSLGQPVPGSKIKVRMQRHAFGFGSTFKSKYLLEDDLNAQKYRNTFDELFSCLVPVPSLIPRHSPNMHSGNYAKKQLQGLQRVMEWAQGKEMSMRGHTLVWGNLQPWSNELAKAGQKEDILAFMNQHLHYVLSQTQGFINEWDAINHPIRFQKDLRDLFGEKIYEQLLDEQKRATDSALIINEALFDNQREDSFYEFMVKLQTRDGPKADGIGFQSHFTTHNLRGMEDLWRRYQRFSPLANRMVVTEYDLVCNDDQLHADYLRDILTLTFSHPKMTGFINWGFWAGEHWKPEGGLFRKDWKARPAVKVWRDLVKKNWWTEAEIRTNQKGEAQINRAFYGVYEIEYEFGDEPILIHHTPDKKLILIKAN